MRTAMRGFPENKINRRLLNDLKKRLEFEIRTVHRIQYFKSNNCYRIYFKSGEKSERYSLKG